MLEQVACPNCQAPIDVRKTHAEGSHIECPSCGGKFLLRGHVCPLCGTYHAQEAAFCRQCGTTLTRRCTQCETINWIGDEYCVKCGIPLDILEVITHRLNYGTQDRLYQQMDSGQSLKQAEEAASQERMARMMEAERQRQLEIQQRLTAQREHERKLLTGLWIGGSVLFLVVVLVIIISLAFG